jgi:hypothetical protein
MGIDNASRSRRARAGIALTLLFTAGSASVVAAPVVTGISGKLDHKASVTILGTGFGTKGQAAPVVWDDASGSDVLGKWDLAWPNSNPAYNLGYRAPQRGISLPHNHITKYLAGAHGDSGNAGNGAAVMVWKNRTISSYPAYTYASWYQRADDAWVFGGDDNYKVFDFSHATGGYDLPYNWYLEYNPRPTSRTSGASWHILDDAFGQALASLSGPISNWWSGGAVNPMAGRWSKVELQIKYSHNSDGYVKLWENGVQQVNYSGTTDNYAGNVRSEGVGGYARQYGQPSNWRYFADVYLDYSPAHVVLANNAVLASATIIEPQIPSAWSASSITATVNLGQFETGQTAYLIVVDSSGAPSAAGLPVTAGAGGSLAVPNAPPGVTVK